MYKIPTIVTYRVTLSLDHSRSIKIDWVWKGSSNLEKHSSSLKQLDWVWKHSIRSFFFLEKARSSWKKNDQVVKRLIDLEEARLTSKTLIEIGQAQSSFPISIKFKKTRSWLKKIDWVWKKLNQLWKSSIEFENTRLGLKNNTPV